MTFPTPTPRRLLRVATAAAMALAIAVTGSGVAWAAGASGGSAGPGSTAAAPASPASSEGSLQIQAQELAGQIQANGVQLDQLDEAYNAAELQYLQIGSQVAGLQKAMAQTDRTVAAVKREMRSQAVLDYITGGAPIISHVPVLPSNPNLATSYAEIIAGSQRRAIDAYHQVMLQQARQDRELESARQQAAVTLTAIQTDRAAATQALAQQRSTLDQVKGKLALAVAAVEAQQQRAEQIAVETSLTQQGQLPSASSAASAAGSSAATHPGGSPGAGGSSGSNPAPPVTTDPVGPSQPVISPTTPAPDPTTAPPTSPGPTTPPTTAPVAGPPAAGSGPAPGYQLAIAYARAQIGKPYAWGGAGPNSFDCSGLVMMAWAQAGVYFPHLAQDQYDMTARIPLAHLLPGDLVFYGTPSDVYHVGLYIGGGEMIAAPETGQNVQIQSIYYSGLLGGGRVRG